MKKYRFRLDQVLGVRRVQEELAKAKLARANRAVAQSESDVADRLDRYRETPWPADGVTTEQYLRARHRLERSAAAVLAAGVRRQVANESLVAARVAWTSAAGAVTMLEHLEERRRQEHAQLAAREEQRAADELATVRYLRGMGGQAGSTKEPA